MGAGLALDALGGRQRMATACLAWSHAFMDAAMHADLQLLWPWSPVRLIYGTASTTDIEIALAAAAVLRGWHADCCAAVRPDWQRSAAPPVACSSRLCLFQ